MKFIHIADLHLGKSVCGVSMLENGDQRDWIDKFLAVCDREKPDAVLIAGDVYDRSAPSGNAVDLLDYFLTELADRNIPVCLIAGNHDSGQRLAFANELLVKAKVHIAGVPAKEMKCVTFQDEFGPVHVWMMPYLFPELVSELLKDETIRSYDAAARKLLAAQKIDFSERNVLIAHQNVIANGKEVPRGGSESMVGGVGEIDYTAFDGFDYVALGHIHSGYPVGRPEVRYAGTPLCYHFSETRQAGKGVVAVEIGQKNGEHQTEDFQHDYEGQAGDQEKDSRHDYEGQAEDQEKESRQDYDEEAGDQTEESSENFVKIRRIPIEPLHRMRLLRGTKAEIYHLIEEDTGRGEYMSIHITDARIDPDISTYLRGTLESRGTILMELMSENRDYAAVSESISRKSAEEKKVEELFGEFYEKKNADVPPDDAEYEVMKIVAEAVRNTDPHEALEVKTVDQVLRQVKKAAGNQRQQ